MLFSNFNLLKTSSHFVPTYMTILGWHLLKSIIFLLWNKNIREQEFYKDRVTEIK